MREWTEAELSAVGYALSQTRQRSFWPRRVLESGAFVLLILETSTPPTLVEAMEHLSDLAGEVLMGIGLKNPAEWEQLEQRLRDESGSNPGKR